MSMIIFTIVFVGLFAFMLSDFEGRKINLGIPRLVKDKNIRSWKFGLFVVTPLAMLTCSVLFGDPIIYNDNIRQEYIQLFTSIPQSIMREPLFFVAHIIMLHFGVYWTVFDLVVNLKTGKKWNYISDNDEKENDAKSDLIFQVIDDKYSGTVQVILKALIFLSALAILIGKL